MLPEYFSIPSITVILCAFKCDQFQRKQYLLVAACAQQHSHMS